MAKLFEIRCRPDVGMIAIVFTKTDGSRIYVRSADVMIGPPDKEGLHLCSLPMDIAIERGFVADKWPKNRAETTNGTSDVR